LGDGAEEDIFEEEIDHMKTEIKLPDLRRRKTEFVPQRDTLLRVLRNSITRRQSVFAYEEVKVQAIEEEDESPFFM